MFPADTSELWLPRIAAGLEVWVRRPSHSLRVIFLCSQPLKSRAHLPALARRWTKIQCDLTLLGLEKALQAGLELSGSSRGCQP